MPLTGEGSAEGEQHEEDPEVTVAKYMAYRSAERNAHRKALIVSWAIAAPAAYLATVQFSLGQKMIQWLPSGSREMPPDIYIQILTGMIVFSVILLALFPLQIHLRRRWSPARDSFGLSNGGGPST